MQHTMNPMILSVPRLSADTAPSATATSQPRTWIVTRHPGALQWLAEQGWQGTAVPHFDPAQVQPGDRVVGTLPVQLAAEVCAAGGHYLHLTLDVTLQTRGVELSPALMQACAARVQAYWVQAQPNASLP